VQLLRVRHFLRNVAQSLEQSLEHPTWDREAAGENHAIPTISTLAWPNISGIRLLSGFMQVRILPAAPLPGGVKVARRFVKPRGVGASPTLAANFTEGRQVLAHWHRAGCCLSRKQDRLKPEVGALPGGRLQRHFRQI
jgi:hypothetical protein